MDKEDEREGTKGTRWFLKQTADFRKGSSGLPEGRQREERKNRSRENESKRREWKQALIWGREETQQNHTQDNRGKKGYK